MRAIPHSSHCAKFIGSSCRKPTLTALILIAGNQDRGVAGDREGAYGEGLYRSNAPARSRDRSRPLQHHCRQTSKIFKELCFLAPMCSCSSAFSGSFFANGVSRIASAAGDPRLIGKPELFCDDGNSIVFGRWREVNQNDRERDGFRDASAQSCSDCRMGHAGRVCG